VRRQIGDGVYSALDLVGLTGFHLRSLHGQFSKTVAHVLQAKTTSYTGLRLMNPFRIVVW
jgi:hypothetical protein